jgi:MFS family permease
MPEQSAPATTPPRSDGWLPALRVRDFRLWWLAQMAVNVSVQMIGVAMGWQVYTAQRSTLALGLIGLAEFVPLFVLALPAGHLADRLPRRLIFGGSLMLGAAVAGGLALISAADVTAELPYLGLAVGVGVTMALESPASGAMPPTLVSPQLLANAMSLRSIATASASVLGPALGGLLFAVSAPLPYLVACGACVAGAACALAMRPSAPKSARTRSEDLHSVLEGLRFVRHTPVLLGAILLDLLGVLFGGAVGLLPVFARSYLHVGPAGLGVLRAAPAIGALLGAAVITRRPLAHNNGPVLLAVVAVFGACIAVFGLSRSFPLSLAMLGLSGFVDLFSMQIRLTMSALTTPERLRGRVGAVEMVFISASNELGTFESGLAASLIGAVPAVVAGGALTIMIAICWRWAFPALARVDHSSSALTSSWGSSRTARKKSVRRFRSDSRRSAWESG